MTNENYTATTVESADPVTDIDRLIDISGYDLEAPGLRVRLDGLARQAAQSLGTTAAMISIVLDTAQLVAGSHGIDGTWIAEAEGTPVEWSFCANVVRAGAPYVVTDAATDPLQRDNPLVLLDGVRSYAGVPLLSDAGNVLGACCVVDFVPREFTTSNLDELTRLAADVITELSHHHNDDDGLSQ